MLKCDSPCFVSNHHNKSVSAPEQHHSPRHPEPDSEEDSDEEQQSAYQKLLSTMIQGADDNSEDEESDEDDGEEVEGKLFYSLIVSTFQYQLQCWALIILFFSQLGESEEEEEEGDVAEADLEEEVGETPDNSQNKEHPEKTSGDIEENEEGEFTDKKNEAAFCLETNLPVEGEENMGEQEEEGKTLQWFIFPSLKAKMIYICLQFIVLQTLKCNTQAWQDWFP